MATPLYLDPNTSVNAAITKPSGYLGALWNGVSVAGTAGAGCKAACLAAAVGAAVVDSVSTTTSTANVAIGLAQFVSAPLSGAQTISGTVDLAMLFGAATGSPTVQGALFIGILKPDGTLRSTLYSSIAFDTTFTATLSNTYTIYQTGLTLTSQTAQDGDLIVIEVGVNRTSATNSTVHFAGGGTTAISTNHTNFGTNGQTLVSFSSTLVFAAPLAPTISAAVSAPETITLTYGRDAAITSYTIKRSTSAGAEASYATGQTGAGYVDTAAISNLTYYYTVTAINGTESATSNEASAQATTLFLDVAGTPHPYNFPAGFLGAAGPAGNGGANARALQPASPGAQSSISATIIGGSSTTGIVQMLSDPLVAQTISGTATVAFAVSNPSNNLSVTYRVLLGILKTDGSALRGTLLAQASGSTGTAVALTTEITKFHANFSLSSVVAAAGDVIVIEIAGFSSSATSSTTAPPVVYAGGTTRITASEAATSNAEARVSFSMQIGFQPAYSVTFTPRVDLAATLKRATTRPFHPQIALSAVLHKRTSRTFAPTIALAVTHFAGLLPLAKLFSASLGLSAALTRAPRRAFAPQLALSAHLAKRSQRTFAPTIALSARLTKRVSTQIFAASLTLAASLTRQQRRTFHATLPLAATLTKRTSRTVHASLALSTHLARYLRRGFTAGLSLSATLPAQLHQHVPVTIAAQLPLAATLSRTITRRWHASLSLSAHTSTHTSRRFAAVLPLTAALHRTRFVRFVARLALTSGMTRTIARRFDARLALTSSMTRLLSRTWSAALSMRATLVHTLPYHWVRRTTHTDRVTPTSTGTDAITRRSTGTDDVGPFE